MIGWGYNELYVVCWFVFYFGGNIPFCVQAFLTLYSGMTPAGARETIRDVRNRNPATYKANVLQAVLLLWPQVGSFSWGHSLKIYFQVKIVKKPQKLHLRAAISLGVEITFTSSITFVPDIGRRSWTFWDFPSSHPSRKFESW